MPAAALTLGALGVAGLIEWPLVLAIGGGALLLRQLNNGRADGSHKASVTPVRGGSDEVDQFGRFGQFVTASQIAGQADTGTFARHTVAHPTLIRRLGTFGTVRASPLRAVALGIQVTSALVGATVQTAANAAGSLGTVASTGLTMAAIPVREGVKALSDGLPAPTLTRHSWRGKGRAWIEVRGLDGPDGDELGRAVVDAVLARPGVTSASLNRPLSRVVVTPQRRPDARFVSCAKW